MAGNIVYAYERFGAAALYTYGSGLSVVCTSADVYYSTITGALVQGDWSVAAGDVVPDTANNSIKIQRSGFYRCGFSVSASASKVSKLHADIWVNGVEKKQISAERDISNVGQVGNFGNGNVIWLNAGDVVMVKFESDTAATNIGLEHFALSVERMSRA